MKQSESHQAVCLKLTPFREADVIASFYTPESGLMRAVCKGIKKSTSKLAGACQPLTLNQVELSNGKNKPKTGALYTLTGYHRLNEFSAVRGQLLASTLATGMAEVVYHLSEDSDSQLIFNHLCQTLGKFETLCHSNKQAHWDILMEPFLQFNLELLQDIGYGLHPEACVSCLEGLEVENPFQAFSALLGGFLCRSCYQQQPYLVQQAVVKVSKATFQCISRTQVNPRISESLYKFFTYLWEFRLEKKLNSPIVLEQLFV